MINIYFYRIVVVIFIKVLVLFGRKINYVVDSFQKMALLLKDNKEFRKVKKKLNRVQTKPL